MATTASDLAMAATGTTAFAYWILLKLPRGTVRILATIPWIVLLAVLAWNVPTVHLRSLVSFFFLWMIPFKLMLLCWDRGPAADPAVKSSFPMFFAAMAMSIHVPRCGTFIDRPNSSQAEPWTSVLARALLKLWLVVLLFGLYAARDQLPDSVIFFMFSLHIYLAASLIFEALAAVAGAFLGLELEPHFDKPFLAASVSDFWGRRWNLLVGSVLRASVYEPLLAMTAGGKPKSRVELSAPSGAKTAPALWARAVATLLVFLVSGLMHEAIFCYINRSGPTWEVTAFFVLNGVATVSEVLLRKQFGHLGLPKPVSVLLTLSFLFFTACWLFFPPIHRPGSCFQALDEFETVLAWLRSSLGLENILSSSPHWRAFTTCLYSQNKH